MLSLGSFPALVLGRGIVGYATELVAAVAVAAAEEQTSSVDLGHFDTIIATGHTVQPPLVLVGMRSPLLGTLAMAMPYAVAGIPLFVATHIVAAACH